jgi:hypothetical protein
MKMSTKKIINESIAKNPLGLKEVFEEAIMERVALALEAKKLDKVNPDALKGDFEDREDKDIDNDGDVDDSDEYLHNRRKTIMKAMKKESVGLDEAITPQNKKDAENVIAHAKKNGGKGIATSAGDNSIIPNIQIVRYLESIGKVKNVKELPSGKGWKFELKESVDLDEARAIKYTPDEAYKMGFGAGKGGWSSEVPSNVKLSKALQSKYLDGWKDGKKEYKTKKESVDLDEAKMSDIDILRAARRLASVGKDDKTKEFGRGLLAFHTKHGSFTPAQVSGLQNIMKNAGFQFAKESVVLSEAKKDKPAFGSSDGFSYAVNLNGIDNEFFKQPFGRQLDAMKKVKEFTSKAKKGYAGAKGKSTLAAVKDWVKLNQPTQFYAKWKSDSSSYKDDSVEIYYMKEANESLNESKEIEKLGAEAFNSGIKRQVVMDPKMKDHIASKDKIAAMKAWYKGWDRENLKD